jgi:hypothetical protein
MPHRRKPSPAAPEKPLLAPEAWPAIERLGNHRFPPPLRGRTVAEDGELELLRAAAGHGGAWHVGGKR